MFVVLKIPVRAQQDGHGTGRRAGCHRPILQCRTMYLQTGLIRTNIGSTILFSSFDSNKTLSENLRFPTKVCVYMSSEVKIAFIIARKEIMY